MRYFLLLLSLCTLGGLITLRFVPTYDSTIERSTALHLADGTYHVATDRSKNTWYLGFPAGTVDDALCVDWSIGNTKKTQCVDHDGNSSNEIFTFPLVVDPEKEASFSLRGATIDPRDITVYSMDTRPSGSRITFVLPGAIAESGIISRAEWGADETLRYADSPQWTARMTSYKQYLARPKTQAELDAIKKENDKDTFMNNRPELISEVVSMIRYENGHPLAWPIQTVKKVSRIVIHHTDDDMNTARPDEEIIRAIYVYHTISRHWGDIGYNYIVGQRGNIYEGRAGGDYVVGAHASYNNMGTVGISVLGNFTRDTVNRDQFAGVERAITMMAQKYGITLSDTKQGVIKCDTAACYPFQIVTTKSLIGHRDVGSTDCPGSNLYKYIPDIINRLDKVYTPVLNSAQSIKDPLPTDEQNNLTLAKNSTPTVVVTASTSLLPKTRYIGQRFRVKLSYPDAINITFSTGDGGTGKLLIDGKSVAIGSKEKAKVGLVGNSQLSINIGDKVYTGSNVSLSQSIIRIDSWSRIPDWDRSGKYNDNLFRDTIRVQTENGKLLVTSELPLEWYLKGMGEVSNGDLPEKVKTIIVAARAYAKFYMQPQNRKFGTRLYDGSDDPDEFQKYLGYGYESRSPNIAKLVDQTRSEVITYSGQLIKPWYHSSSDGRTLSALEYCLSKTPNKKCEDIPYLQSVVDPGGVGKSRSGHGVGISGIGATYFAKEGWDYKKIIQYYLQGVNIERK